MGGLYAPEAPLPPPPPGPAAEVNARIAAARAQGATAPDDGGIVWPFFLGGFILVAMLVGFTGVFAHLVGDTQGYARAWREDRWTCLRTEDRQFAEIGFLGIGTGEIVVRNVCVEWRVVR